MVYFNYPFLQCGKILAFVFENNEVLSFNKKIPQSIRRIYNFYKTDKIFEHLKKKHKEAIEDKNYEVSQSGMYFILVGHANSYKKNLAG